MDKIIKNEACDEQENEVELGLVSLGNATILTRSTWGHRFEYPHGLEV